MRYLAATTLILALALALATPVLAQPAMSRGEQILPLSYQDCMSRAAGAFRSYGWVNIGSGGAYTNAFRGGSGAYITCNEAVPGRMIVNIFVASNGGDAARERQELQGAMGDLKNIPRAGGCGWIDGHDSRVPNDVGRGVTSFDAHRAHVMNNGVGGTAGLVGARAEALQKCLPREVFARFYADGSVLVAGYGRRVGWLDGHDGRIGKDSGRGISNWQAHYDHAARTGEPEVGRLFTDRLNAIYPAVPRETAAQLYGELSVLIARYGVGN